MRSLRSARALTAIVAFVAFNAAAVAWFVASDGPISAASFAIWFAGDVVIGLIVLALTEPG